MAGKTTYYYKLFRVKRSDGRITTVSLDPALVTKACRVMGGVKEVGKAVRASAGIYEDGQARNCSGFVSEKLRQSIQECVQANESAKQLAAA